MKETSTRRDFSRFLKNPNFNKQENLTIKLKIAILFKVLILTYIGIIVAQLPYRILNGLNMMDAVSSNGLKVVQGIVNQNGNYKWYFIFSSVFLAPLLEETSFRFFLTKFKINYFIISVSFIFGSLVIYYFGNLLWRPESYLLLLLSTYIYVLVISGIFGFVLWQLKGYLIEIKSFWDSNSGLIFYSVAILFALFHLINIDLKLNNFLFAPILLLPFFVFGLSFGYIRIRLGMVYSVILHIIILSIWFGLPELAKALKN